MVDLGVQMNKKLEDIEQKGERTMQVTIDKEILGILDLLKIPESELETTINVFLIEGLNTFVTSEDLQQSEELKVKILAEILKLKLKYITKMLEIAVKND